MKRACLFSVLLLVLALSVSLSTPTFANPVDPINLEPLTLNATNTVTSVADAHVNQAYPTTNYGTATALRVDGSPAKRGYLRFTVAGLTSGVSKATLRLYATSSLSTGITVSRVADNAWGETTITYNNAPAVGTAIGTSSAATAGSWLSMDVTSYVRGNGTFSFALTGGNATALSLESREAANKPQLVVTTVNAPTPTPIAPLPTKVLPTLAPTKAPTPSGSVRVLCDGKVYDGFTTRLFQLDTPIDQDPKVQKVIRNCVFRNSKQVPILIKNAKNVLIEGNSFENIRTYQAGNGVHAINITGPDAGGVVDGVTIRNNSFKAIGADGIQLGQNTRAIRNVWIQNNEFVGRADVGENGVDVKGVEGPIYITGNKVHGFRPCESPKTNPPGNQDCSGSNGPGITVHDGGNAKTPAYNVTLENNDLYDNTMGLVVATGARNIVVRGNRINNNQKQGVEVHDVYSLSITNNTLSYNPTHISISNTPQSGGSCTISANTFVGGGTTMSGSCR